jgi:hypothetical protein
MVNDMGLYSLVCELGCSGVGDLGTLNMGIDFLEEVVEDA